MSPDQKILVIRFSSIGDIVLATSPLRTIRSAFPDAQITFLTLDKFSPLLEFHPDIDRLISIPSSLKFKKLWTFGAYIKRNKYDIIYDLHNSIRSNIVTLQSSAQSFQLKKPRFNRMMLFHFHENYFESEFSTRFMYHQHVGSIWDGNHGSIPKTLLRLSAGEIKKGRRLLSDRGVMGDYVSVIPGAAWKQKRWPVNKYIETLNKLDIPSVLIGSKDDTICRQINKGLINSLDLSGKTDLREALSVIASSKHVIGSDTGLVHGAEALGKNVSMILGPTSTETGAGVALPDSKNIQKDIRCRPCSQNGSVPCYREKQYCMESITPEEVLNSLQTNV